MRRWFPFLSLVAVIFLVSAVGRRIQTALKAQVGAGGMLLIATAGTLLLGLVLLSWMQRQSISRQAMNTAGVLIVALFGTVLVLRDNPEEAFHFLEYGLLGYAALVALAPGKRELRHFLFAAFAASVVGAAEECLQGFLPGRFFDLRDIRFNTEAACLVQIVLAAMTYRRKEET